MISLLFAILIGAAPLAAAICLGGSRLLPARTQGLGGAALLLAALGALVALWPAQGAVLSPELAWSGLNDARVALQLRLDGLNAPLLALTLLAGVLTLTLLALAFSPGIRGFGALFATLFLALTGVVLSLLIADPLLLPLGWALTALGAYGAARAASVSEGEGRVTDGAMAGAVTSVLAALALLIALLAGISPAEPVPSMGLGGSALLLLLLAAMLAMGLPPFHSTLAAAAATPAELAALVAGFGMPLLGGYTLLHLGVLAPAIAPPWPLALVLIGLLSTLLSAAAALQQRSLRRMLGWQLSGQAGALLAALGAGGQQGAVAALALLINMALIGLCGMLALALLERRTGSDSLNELPRLRSAMPLVGLAFGVAAASSLGLPPTWGLWGRLWLAGALQAAFPWAVAPLLVASSLAALAWVAPLVAFWRTDTARPEPRPLGLEDFLPAVAALALVALGVYPQLLNPGFEAVRIRVGAQTNASFILPNLALQALLALAALALLVIGLRARSLPSVARIDEERATLPPVQGLAQSVGWLRALAEPVAAEQVIWHALLIVAHGLRAVLALFEQRYYLAGILLATISLLLLMVQ